MAWWDSLFGDGGGDSSGGSWWGALMSGVSAWSQSREREEEQERGGLISRESIAEQGRQSRLNTEYETGLADYYRQLERQRKRQGFSNFGQFATNQYTPTYTPPALGAPMTAAQFEAAQRTGG